MMTLRQIRHFIAVAETGSISAAAQAVFISQSTLTLAIQQLERQVGGCTATTERPTVFASESPVGVAAQPMEVDVSVPGETIDWRCYRYRVFETVVPLRNSQWSPSNAMALP